MEVALRNKRIVNKAVEDLKEVLRLVMLKIGLRAINMPNEEEKQVLINHILTNFGNHTCEEILLAFDMAIIGKLNVEVNCYENFSCLYFSNIMYAYREWSREEIKHIKQEVKELPAPVDKDHWTDNEQVETARKLYKMLKKYRCITQKVAAILFRQGKIGKPNEEDREVILKQATKDYHEELRTDKGFITFGDKEDEIRKICNQILVAKFFNL